MIPGDDHVPVKPEAYATLALTHAEVHRAADLLIGTNDASVWSLFSCSEAEALADVFRAAGRDDVADMILAKHKTYDEAEEIDYHLEIQRRNDDQS